MTGPHRVSTANGYAPEVDVVDAAGTGVAWCRSYGAADRLVAALNGWRWNGDLRQRGPFRAGRMKNPDGYPYGPWHVWDRAGWSVAETNGEESARALVAALNARATETPDEGRPQPEEEQHR